MSVVSNLLHWGASASGWSHIFGQPFGGGPTPPPPPAVPNPNTAANASQQQTDAMRMRRGLLANIYAGAFNQAPVVGKTQLGS